MLDNIAAGFLVFATLGTALFQLAIVLGAPLGQYAYGGRTSGKLATGYRVASLISFGFFLAAAGHYLAQLGVFELLLEANLNTATNWFFVAVFTISAVLNNMTKSESERRLWGSTTITMAIAALLIAL